MYCRLLRTKDIVIICKYMHVYGNDSASVCKSGKFFRGPPADSTLVNTRKDRVWNSLRPIVPLLSELISKRYIFL